MTKTVKQIKTEYEGQEIETWQQGLVFVNKVLIDILNKLEELENKKEVDNG